MNTQIRIVVVEDHDLVREGLLSVLGREGDIVVVGQAATVDDALGVVAAEQPDLVLLDLRLGRSDGREVARRLRADGFAGRILVLSIHDTAQDLHDALAAGADGYLLKSVSGSELAEGIRAALAGETVIGHEFVPKVLQEAVLGEGAPAARLTPRERQVLELGAAGRTNRQVGTELGISNRTAQKHVENLFRKLGVHDREELVAQASRSGLLS